MARHDEISKWQHVDLIMLALYTLRMSNGEDATASYVKIADILSETFELSTMSQRMIRRALEAARKLGESYINPGARGKRGFRISPTGVRRIKEMLNLEQAGPDDNNPNGAPKDEEVA